MAALPEHTASVVDLRKLRIEDLDPLLEEEVAVWEERLEWDFRPSADLVRRFVRMQSLRGFALVTGSLTIGYCYYVCEDHKGLVGDIYVMQEFATAELEATLLAAVVGELMDTPEIKRVESQLLMLSEPGRRHMPYPLLLRTFERDFMRLNLDRSFALAPGAAYESATFQNWHEREQEMAARLIAKSYRGHVDAEINDQYRSIGGARRFLMNIVQYPGCGTFYQPGSFVALDATSGQLAGISLASMVAFDVGHITQICVDPAWRGRGLGYELMRLSLNALVNRGCRRASLTVTSSNADAIHLYEQIGFSTWRRFEAFVWDKAGRSG